MVENAEKLGYPTLSNAGKIFKKSTNNTSDSKIILFLQFIFK